MQSENVKHWMYLMNMMNKVNLNDMLNELSKLNSLKFEILFKTILNMRLTVLVKCSLFLFYFVHLLIENIIQLHLFDNQKDVRKTREEIWCQGRKNDCYSPWLMIMTCNCNEWCDYRTCETQKSQSDYFTTTCISMKPIHWKCTLTWWQKSFHRSDSLKWLSWIRAVHIPSFLQWLNESIRSRK